MRGSSETIRRTTFNLDFIFWFVGFLEGDGSFICSNNRLFFVITQNELIVLNKIKFFFKCGRVQKHGKYFRFIITNQRDFFWLIQLIWEKIIFFNTWYRIHLCIAPSTFSVNLINANFLQNAWLSGFIDAKGCFYIRLSKSQRHRCGYLICLMFILDQKVINEYDMIFFSRLSKQLGGYTIKRKENNFLFYLENHTDLSQLIKYLKRYPLRSHKKTIQFEHWLTCFRIKQKDEITPEDILKIKKIKSWRYSPPKYESI